METPASAAARAHQAPAYPSTPPTTAAAAMATQTRTLVVYAAPYAYARSGAPLFLEVRPEHSPVAAGRTPEAFSWAQFLALQRAMAPARPDACNTSTPTSGPVARLPPRGRPSGRAVRTAATPSPRIPARATVSSPLATPKMGKVAKRRAYVRKAPRWHAPPAARTEHTPESVRRLPPPPDATPTPESVRRPRARTLHVPLRHGRGLLPSLKSIAPDSTPSPVPARRVPRSSGEATVAAAAEYASDDSSDATLSDDADAPSTNGSPTTGARRHSLGRIQRFARGIIRRPSAPDPVSTPVKPGKRPRVVWAGDLEEKFEEALRALGVDTALPRQILARMDVPSLTRKHVSSHLQKYRAALEKERERVRTKLAPKAPVSPVSASPRKRKRGGGGDVGLPPRKQAPWRLPPISPSTED